MDGSEKWVRVFRGARPAGKGCVKGIGCRKRKTSTAFRSPSRVAQAMGFGRWMDWRKTGREGASQIPQPDGIADNKSRTVCRGACVCYVRSFVYERGICPFLEEIVSSSRCDRRGPRVG